MKINSIVNDTVTYRAVLDEREVREVLKDAMKKALPNAYPDNACTWEIEVRKELGVTGPVVSAVISVTVDNSKLARPAHE